MLPPPRPHTHSPLPTHLPFPPHPRSYTPPSPSDACIWHRPLPGASQLLLSADEAALAAVTPTAVLLYGLDAAFAMGAAGAPGPQWQLLVEEGVKVGGQQG